MKILGSIILFACEGVGFLVFVNAVLKAKGYSPDTPEQPKQIQ